MPPQFQMLPGATEWHQATAGALELEAMRRGPAEKTRRRIADKPDRTLTQNMDRDIKAVLWQPRTDDPGGWLHCQHRVKLMMLHEPTVMIFEHGT